MHELSTCQGGQFSPAKGGQFAPAGTGQFDPASGGQFIRRFQPRFLNPKLYSSDFRLYPNPTEDFLQVLTSNPIDKSLRVVITDLSGKQLISSWILKDGNQVYFSTRSLASGIYFCLVISENKITWTDKFVKIQ